ncbi:MAG: response regulator [Planctomycetota bacterium]|nr:response regulator [Planctomycetota bacterium]
MVTSPRILIVDDEPSICKSCCDILGARGWRVETALTGDECVRKTRDKSFDVVILDLKIPDVAGTELLRLVKKSHPETYIIIITGYSSVESAVETMKMGASDYIPKPFTPDEIRLAVERVLGRRCAVKEEKGGRVISAKDVKKVLEKAACDEGFVGALLEQGSDSLAGFTLSSEEKSAILSGDIKWIEERVGRLSEEQKVWLYSRLQQERW